MQRKNQSPDSRNEKYTSNRGSNKTNHADSFFDKLDREIMLHHNESHSKESSHKRRHDLVSREDEQDNKRPYLGQAKSSNHLTDNIPERKQRHHYSKAKSGSIKYQLKSQEELMTHLKSKNVQIDVCCYNKYLKLLIENGDYQKALDVYYNDLLQSIEPDIITNTSILNLYVQWGKVEPSRFAEGLTFYGRLKTKTDLITNNTLLQLYT